MIKNIVFDIGQVLVEFNWRKYLAEWFPDIETARHVAEATILNELWMEIDRGAKSFAEVVENCVSTDPAYESEIRTFFEKKSEIVREYAYAPEWIAELKQRGYQVYLLSNYAEHSFAYLKERTHFLDLVDGKIISYQVKSVKPEPEIYEKLFTTYQLVPKECVFLDDLQKNLDAAAAFGMKTILFTGYEEGREALERLLVQDEQNKISQK